MAVIVTGGAGFIGSNLVEKLIEIGEEVVVIDNLSSGKKENVPTGAVLRVADVRNKEELEAIWKEVQPKKVFHLAAQPLVEKAYEDPVDTLEVNIMGTANVLEACRKQGDVEAIVVVSSDKAYGKSKKLPYTEDILVGGDHPYEVSKAGGDLIAQSYQKTYGMPIAIARFGNAFGPKDWNFGRIIPDCFEAVLKNKELEIRSDGNMIREYVYVKDVAAGCIALADQIEKSKGRAYNFGSNNIFTVLEVVKEVGKILNKEIGYKVLNITKNEIPEQRLDWSRAKSELNWEPQYTFETSIEESFQWYKEHVR